MFPVRKILISTTILIPLIITIIFIILYNFGVIKKEDSISLFSPFFVNPLPNNIFNTFIKGIIMGKIVNGIWYCLILLAVLLGSLKYITS